MSIPNIDREHPEYIALKRAWKKYRDLYVGGERLRENAAEYLVRRHKEPGEIYGKRLSRVFYENYVGSIIDWYAATLLRREPILLFEGRDDAATDFYNLFADNCDLKGTSISEYFRQRLIQALICGSSYVVVEFPRFSEPVLTRADEDASGRSRAYLVDYWPDEVINWNYSEDGRLDWAVIRTSCLKQSTVPSGRAGNLPALSNQKQGEVAKGTKRMDLRGYFEKIKEFEAKTKDAFAVIVSLESPDGGKAGIITEVSRSLAAKMVVECARISPVIDRYAVAVSHIQAA